MKEYGAIFDLDGVIVDTEPIYSEAMQKLAEKRGKEFTLEIKRKVMGTAGLISMSVMKKSLGLTESPEELLKERGKIYQKLLYEQGVKPMQGIFNAINVMNRLGLRKAIASSSRLEWIEFPLNELNLANEFDVIVHGNEVKYGKPAPDIFILALKKLGLPSDRCIVLEDTVVGVQSAKGAKIKCIAIPNQYNRDMDFSLADVVIKSLEEINEEMVRELLNLKV
jgi:HAD superfamily hydrolase (TIGR01509 family)